MCSIAQANNYWRIVVRCQRWNFSTSEYGTCQAMENMAMEKGYQHWPADIQVFSHLENHQFCFSVIFNCQFWQECHTTMSVIKPPFVVKRWKNKPTRFSAMPNLNSSVECPVIHYFISSFHQTCDNALEAGMSWVCR